ncbi:hypothetical protein BsWGS_08440 [Bradybaena similaris]
MREALTLGLTKDKGTQLHENVSTEIFINRQKQSRLPKNGGKPIFQSTALLWLPRLFLSVLLSVDKDCSQNVRLKTCAFLFCRAPKSHSVFICFCSCHLQAVNEKCVEI